MTVRRPIAAATPTRDPAAETRNRLRRADRAYRDALARTREARAALASEIVDAHASGLSHRQIARTLDRVTMTVHKMEQAGLSRRLDLRREA